MLSWQRRNHGQCWRDSDVIMGVMHGNGRFPPIRRPIDLFRGACAVKGNVQVAGHVKPAPFSRRDVTLGDVDGSLFYIKIWFFIGHHDQYGYNWGNISQFAMWLSQCSVYIYKTDQSTYQFQHLAARFDSVMIKWTLPHLPVASSFCHTHRPNK